MKKIILLTLFCLIPLISYGEIIKVTCIVKYQGNKTDEWNFTFITPPDGNKNRVLKDGRPMENSRQGFSSEIFNLNVNNSNIGFTNVNTETYDSPQIYEGITYKSSEINWIFDISRVTGKFSITEYRKGLQKVVSPDVSISTGQCQPTIQKF